MLNRIKYTDKPGSPEWVARRQRHYNAGDASALLSCHPSGKTRAQVLHQLQSGMEQEFSDYVQENVIDPGHRVEELGRAIAAEILQDEDLEVVAYGLDIGLARPLGASLDAVDFLAERNWECKSLNEALRQALPHAGRDSHHQNDARNLPKGYRVQMEQQQLCSGAQITLFSALEFDDEGNVVDERHCWYKSDDALRAEIIGAWKQAEADLPTFVMPVPTPKLVAEPVEALPAPVVTVSGTLTLQDNFKVFERKLRHFLAEKLITEPKTDQDFADLDLQIKEMKRAREALKSAEAQMLAQVAPVDAAKKYKDMLDDLLQKQCSASEKLLKEEKERRKRTIVANGIRALNDHAVALDKRLGGAYMPPCEADFAGAIKGMSSLANMEAAVDGLLARAKVTANQIADRIQENLKTIADAGEEYQTLFVGDKVTLARKACDDCRAQVQARIAQHKAAEEKRLEEERARIRAEEQERAEAAAREKNAMALQEIQGIQQQVAIATLGRAGVRKGGTIQCIRETLAETEAWDITEERFGALTVAAQAAKEMAVAEIRRLLAEAEAPTAEPAPAPATVTDPAPYVVGRSDHDRINDEAAARLMAGAPNVHPLPARGSAPQQRDLTLTMVCQRLGVTLTAAFVRETLKVAGLQERNATKFSEQEFQQICLRLLHHTENVRKQHLQQAA